jgi:hypothetical protein
MEESITIGSIKIPYADCEKTPESVMLEGFARSFAGILACGLDLDRNLLHHDVGVYSASPASFRDYELICPERRKPKHRIMTRWSRSFGRQPTNSVKTLMPLSISILSWG